jgi:hypothetical protein
MNIKKKFTKGRRNLEIPMKKLMEMRQERDKSDDDV